MDMDNQVRHDDPQFVKVLEAYLAMEIATANEKLEANSAKIKRMKTMMRTEVDQRKKLKKNREHMSGIMVTMDEILKRLHISIRETTDNLEIVRANADNEYKLIQLKSQEHQGIIAEFKETWYTYHAMYEEFPLAKARNAAKLHLEKLQIARMVMVYKTREMMTIIKQQRRIDWFRTRCKIIEFANITVKRSKLEEKLMKLKMNVDHRRRELQSIETEMQVQRKREEDQRRLRKEKMLQMGPPKFNIPRRHMYAQNQIHMRDQRQREQIHESFDDTMSVDTVALEELCINENNIAEVNMEPAKDNNPRCRQMKIPNHEDPAVIEKNDTRNVSVTPDARASVEKATLADNDVETRDTHQAEIQESAEMQASSCTKGNSLKHKAAKSAPDEIGAKRIRLQSEDSRESTNKITTPQPPAIVEDIGLKSPPSIPRIRKIETVQYNVPSIIRTPKPAHRSSIATGSIFSTTPYECYDSNISAFDQDFLSKGLSSLCDVSLCNCPITPNSDIPSMCIEENARMASHIKCTSQQDNKNQSDDKESPFQFSNFAKVTKGNFTLF